MSISLNDNLSRRNKFKFRVSFNGYQPEKLAEVASRLEQIHSGLAVKSLPEDIEKLILQFRNDINSLSIDDLHIEWQGKRRSLLDIVIVVGRKNSRESRSDDEIHSILENAFLILLSFRKLQSRYIEAIGFATLNNMGNETLWRMFSGAIEKPEQNLGKRASVWKNHISDIWNPERFVENEFENHSEIASLLKKLSVEGTWLSARLLRSAMHLLGNPEMYRLYREELLGDFDFERRKPENMGLLANLEMNELSAFVNAYCNKLNGLPAKDIVLEYLVSSRVMGVPSAGVKWLHPLVHEQSRDKVDKYLLGVDFRKAFDHILQHQERKQYWLKWLESGHVRRIRVFGNMNKIRRFNFNCSVGSMEFPTLQMDLGSCYAFECGQQGSGALYVYPSNNGPLNWEHKLSHTRGYKRFILDARASLPLNWLNIRHSSRWEMKVDSAFASYYRLRR